MTGTPIAPRFPDLRLRRLRSFLLCALLVPGAPSRADPPAGYRLAWSDEFDGDELDSDTWVHWQSGPRRDAINTADAVTVRDGYLTILTYTAGGRHYTGMISTRGKFEPLHGYFEARINFDDSPGMWSAFWMQSPTMGRPIGDPGSAGTEIDICEHRKVNRSGGDIDGRIQHTLHWDGYGDDHKSQGHFTGDVGAGSGFHTYGLEWTDSAYRFSIDDRVTWTSSSAVSQRTEFIILSSEVQNDSWAGTVPAGGYGESSATRTNMQVDYVRYYAPPSWSPPPPPPPVATLVAAGSLWKFRTGGTRPPADWMGAGYDDSSWAEGAAELGYGDGDEATTIPFGPDESAKWITAYFRREFQLGDPGPATELVLRLKRDDGAIAYLNGVEASRENLPAGPVSHTTRASNRIDGSDEDRWIGSALAPSLLRPGRNVIAVELHQVSPTSSDMSFDLSLEARSILIDTGAVWKYHATDRAPATLWSSVSYDDGAWPSGPAELGYGDGDEATVVPFGPDPANRWITTYFRHAFVVSQVDGVEGLALQLKRDDGAVVYLNGLEAHRDNMPAGAVGHQSEASSTISDGEEIEWVEAALDPGLLRPGTNVIAVEVHQVSATSSDTSFDLRLAARIGTGAAPPPRFRRGDANGDGALDISDASYLLNWLFLGGPVPPCAAAGNANGDTTTDLSDAVYALSFLFQGGPPPQQPFPECGPGPLASDAELGCENPPPQCMPAR